MARLTLVFVFFFIVNGNEFHKTDTAWVKVWSRSVEHLTFGTNRRDCRQVKNGLCRNISLKVQAIDMPIWLIGKDRIAESFIACCLEIKVKLLIYFFLISRALRAQLKTEDTVFPNTDLPAGK